MPSNNSMEAVRIEKGKMKNCPIVPYGTVERLCKRCGYVFWEDKGKTIEEIAANMANSGYDLPACLKVNKENNGK